MNWNESPRAQLHSLLRALEHEACGATAGGPAALRRPRLTHRSTSRTWRAPGRRWWRCATTPHPLLARGAKTSGRGLPDDRALARQQIERARHLSLAEVFRLEYAMSLNCTRHPDSRRGVRARLTRSRQAHRTGTGQVESIPQAVIEAHFADLEGEHPLAGL
ncbi:enoyl-CoA hydratase/isomerase family protein [Pseudomonas aeruginosa]|nr:enoyl-CoA hydratase/isomerase family protein [Pseudomonas aeruginosa]